MRHGERKVIGVQPDMGLGAQKKSWRRNSLRIKGLAARARRRHLPVSLGPLIFEGCGAGRRSVQAKVFSAVSFDPPRALVRVQPATKTDVPNEKAGCRRD